MNNWISPLVQPFLVVMAFMLLMAISLDAPKDSIIGVTVFTIGYAAFITLAHRFLKNYRDTKNGR